MEETAIPYHSWMEAVEKTISSSSVDINHASKDNKNGTDSTRITEQQVRDIFQTYFFRHSIVRAQIESFDYYMENLLPSIIEEYRHIEVISKKHNCVHIIRLVNVRICRPMFKEHDGPVHYIDPSEAMIRKLTYSSAVMVDVIHEVYDRIYDKSQIPLECIEQPSLPQPQQPQQPQQPPTATYQDVLREKRVYAQYTLFRMPVMVGSRCCHTYTHTRASICPYVPGGYFIVNGNEKAFVSQEKQRNNYFVVNRDAKTGNVYGDFRAWNDTKIRTTSTLYISLCCTGKKNHPSLMVDVPFINGSIALVHVFRLLEIDASIVRNVILSHHDSSRPHPYDKYIYEFLKDDQQDLSLDDLKVHIAKKNNEPTREKKIRFVDNIMNNEFLPHIGLERTREIALKKAFNFGILVFRALAVYNGDQLPDDKDDNGNKRMEHVHILCAMLGRQLVRAFMKNCTSQIHKAIDADKYVFVTDMMKNSKRITAGFKYAISTGNWGMSKGASTQTGVVQVLTRMNPISANCHLRRSNNANINKEGKASQPRQLHISAWGISCSSESPEGAACGLVKNMALTTYYRLGYLTHQVMAILPRMVIELLNCTHYNLVHDTRVFINHIWIGCVPANQTQDYLAVLRRWRRIKDLPFCTTIVHFTTKRQICITTDFGCSLRPVFVLENVHKFVQVYQKYRNNIYALWDEMMNHGIIEYVDKEEESTLRVALSWQDLRRQTQTHHHLHDHPLRFTHVEIHPIVVLGISASFVPMANHNPAPRNTYASGMLKQGVGLVGLNAEQRVDTFGVHQLIYPQRPRVFSFTEKMSRMLDVPSGSTPVVAILSYTGYNQEDSVILNKSSVERGMFRSMYFRTFKDTARNAGSEQEVFEKLNVKEVVSVKRANYQKIGDDAFPDIGEMINQDDVIIGKVIQPTDVSKINPQSDTDCKRDRSVIFKYKESARVDKVVTTLTKEGGTLVNLRTRSLRTPAIGDKFSSRHGQKGVCSLILPAEDMPYTQSGMTPDMIINPHAIPSRMTIGQLLETVLGKAAVLEGKSGDGTPFAHLPSDDDVLEDGSPNTESLAERIGKILKTHGYQWTGKEKMYNGTTGEMMEGNVFIGPCFYMRLKHQTSDKVHARSTGPVHITTRQPVEGRARDGGLRYGEMERDCLIAHGAAHVMTDRLMNASDRYETVVCEACGQFAFEAPPKPKHSQQLRGEVTKPWCQRCSSAEWVRRVVIPFAYKLLVQDLEGFHITMNMTVTKED